MQNLTYDENNFISKKKIAGTILSKYFGVKYAFLLSSVSQIYFMHYSLKKTVSVLCEVI